jgi:hypothetical protein
MNERAEFLEHFRSVFIRMVDRLELMTETEVLNGLLQVKAARNIYQEEFLERIKAIQAEPAARHRVAGAPRNTRDEFAYLSSVQVFVNSVNKLRSQVGERASTVSQHVSTAHPSWIFNTLEVALNDRLAALRRGPSNDS